MSQTGRSRFTRARRNRWESLWRISVILAGTAILAIGFWGVLR